MNRKQMIVKKNNAIIKLMIIAILLILIIVIIFRVMARYQSEGRTIGEIEVAIYILDVDYQAMQLRLDTEEPLIPREEPYVHTFSISNNDGTRRTDIPLEYDLIIRTTTNLPLRYELRLVKQIAGSVTSTAGATQNILEGGTPVADSFGTYFRTFTAATREFGYEEDETNIYELLIEFPANLTSSYAYQDVIESIEIIVNSRQIIIEEP